MPETWRETRRLNEDEQKLDATIAHAPVLFQRHVPAIADLRVTVVGEQVFAAAKTAGILDQGVVSLRKDGRAVGDSRGR